VSQHVALLKQNKEALEKVAILLLYLEVTRPKVTRAFFKTIGEERSRIILESMARLGTIKQDKVNATVKDFLNFLVNKESIIGGANLTSKIFEEIYGTDLGVVAGETEAGFKFLKDVPDDKLLKMLAKSSTPFQAFIISYLDQAQASRIVSQLDLNQVKKVLGCLAMINVQSGNKWLLKLESKVAEMFTEKPKAKEQVADEQLIKIAMVLERSSRKKRADILEELRVDQPDMISVIESLIFTYEEIMEISEGDLQKVLAAVDMRTLARALDGADETITKKVLSNISARSKGILEEERDMLNGKATEDDREEGQLGIVSAARTLEAEGQIEKLVKKRDASETQSESSAEAAEEPKKE
jgi:flagellar motor switch protein FliG